jgi:hypothetical protein
VSLQPCPWPTALALWTGSVGSAGSCQTLFELDRVFNWPAVVGDVEGENIDIEGRIFSMTMSIDAHESLQSANGWIRHHAIKERRGY